MEITNIGSVLYEKALSGDIKAVQFYLKTQAERTEIHLELSKAEEPVDRHLTATVVGLISPWVACRYTLSNLLPQMKCGHKESGLLTPNLLLPVHYEHLR